MTLPPFQRLLDEHRTDVYRFLVATVGRQAADDCFQETFCRRCARTRACATRGDLRGWLFTIATRKRWITGGSSDDEPVPVERVPERAAPEPPDGDPELWTAVGTLPPMQRAAVIHRYVLDLSLRRGGGGARDLRGRREGQRVRGSQEAPIRCRRSSRMKSKGGD